MGDLNDENNCSEGEDDNNSHIPTEHSKKYREMSQTDLLKPWGPIC